MFIGLIIIIMDCDSPISIRLNPPRMNAERQPIYSFPAGCGKCLPCLRRRKQQWSFRIQAEARQAFSAYFVTLTYDDNHVPIGDLELSGSPEDHKLFISNLRKLENQKVLLTRKVGSSAELQRALRNQKETGKFTYFGCLEYGDRNSRPHLHYILLNIRDTDNINLAWTDKPIKVGKRTGWVPTQIGDSIGRIDVQDCNINTIDYVLKYMIKDHSGKDYDRKVKERSWMSKGIGLSYVDDEFEKFIKQPEANLVVNDRGSKIGLPRYYRKKLLTQKENDRKIEYISSEISRIDDENRERLERYGKNPDLVDKLARDARKRTLSKGKQRDLK